MTDCLVQIKFLPQFLLKIFQLEANSGQNSESEISSYFLVELDFKMLRDFGRVMPDLLGFCCPEILSDLGTI